MLKKGIDLNITPIKPTTKETNKELEDLLYKVNEDLYFFRNLFINQKAKDYLLGRVEYIGKQLKAVTITRESKQLVRRNYILGELRDIYQNLKSYHPVEVTITEVDPDIERMNKYMTGLYLKDKRENKLSVNSKLEWIKKLKQYSTFYKVTENLRTVQEELLDFFKI